MKNNRGNALLAILVITPIISAFLLSYSGSTLNFLKRSLNVNDVKDKQKLIKEIESYFLFPQHCLKTFEGNDLTSGLTLTSLKLDNGTPTGKVLFAVGSPIPNSSFTLNSLSIVNLDQINPSNLESVTGQLRVSFTSRKNAFTKEFKTDIPIFFKINSQSPSGNQIEHCVADSIVQNGEWVKGLAQGVYYGKGAIGAGPSAQVPAANLGVGDIDVQEYYALNGVEVLKSVSTQADSVLLGFEAGKALTTSSSSGGSVFIGTRSGPYDNTRTNKSEASEVAIGYQAGRGHHDVTGIVEGNISIGSYAGETASAGNLNLGYAAGRATNSATSQRGIYAGHNAGITSLGSAVRDSGIFLGSLAGNGFQNVSTFFNTGFNHGDNIFLGSKSGGPAYMSNAINIGLRAGQIGSHFPGFSLGQDIINIGSSTGDSAITSQTTLIGQEAGGNRYILTTSTVLGHFSLHESGDGVLENLHRTLSIGNNSAENFSDPFNHSFDNTFIGHQAASDFIRGDNNLFIGENSGGGLEDGNYNVFIGHSTQSHSNSINGQLNLGNLLRAYPLGGHNRIHIGSLTTNKKATFVATGVSNTCTIDSSTLCSSDKRLKDDIQPLTNKLSKVIQLKPVEFSWKETNSPDIGFIAQEIEPHIPEVISQTPKGLTLNYSWLSSFILVAVNESYKLIEEFKNDCQNDNSYLELKKSNDNLEKKLDELKKLIQAKKSKFNLKDSE